ncbi:BET1-like protein [Brevipalpus obovatus]|uniref:BET1-like protein n=1 Tax=Brevipalpus obovatus TaxID=246614 RepID=UPI003D9DFDDC
MNSRNDEYLESDNRLRTERLQEKVKVLKSFAVDIEHETKEHNRLLDDVGENFVGLFGSLARGKTRVERLLSSSSGNRKFLCYLSAGITGFLIFSYYLLARSLNS